MDRHIKFRGKRTDNGEWAYGFYNEDGNGNPVIKDTKYHVNDGYIDLIPVHVIPETVGQFTGLYDSNRKEIYEGDIIKTVQGFTAVVEWVKDGRFLGFTRDRKILYIDREPAVEVIGNVHDNRELLTVK
ncbi:MAG: YopX family protein [Prevotellaceae bacterium]|jgi:uncharacterized phage protein (TIGR01671 family)|nr:YopX family protein [Prevotellaceae bacterium]